MKMYQDEVTDKLNGMVCNCCGRKMKVENGILTEGALQVDFTFGFFSNKDGQRVKFDLCENCYNEWTGKFAVPVEEEEITEFV